MVDVIVVGSYVQDLAFRTKRFPCTGETVLGQFSMGQGGKGFNQAVASHRQDVSTLFVGAVGKDAFAKDLKEFAARENIELALEEVSSVGTGAAGILVDADGQNQIIVDTGASGVLSKAHVSHLKEEFTFAKVVVTQAECHLEASAEALRLGSQSGATTVFNPAPVNEGISIELLQLATVLTPNESEFIFLMKHVFGQGLDQDFWKGSDQEIHALCRRFEIPTVVLTLGEQGCFVSHAENSSCGKAERYYRIPAHEVQVRDTTGAGDAFTGGLAAGLVNYASDFRAAVEYASAVAALSTTKTGTAPSMPSRQQVESFRSH